MKILALDASTEYCTAALWLDGEVRTCEERAVQRHSELMLPMVRELLDEAGVELQALDGIAFGAGPGAFTGLRIACGVAQGLAMGAGLPMLGVTTLEALAEGSDGEQVIACLDARIGEIYHGAYRRNGAGWAAVREPSLCLPVDAPQVPGSGWLGCGSGFDLHGDALHERYLERISRVLPGRYPRARHMAALAAPRLAAGQGVDAADAAPLYIRDRVALKEWER